VFEVVTMDNEDKKRYLLDFFTSLSWLLDYIDAFRVDFDTETNKKKIFAHHLRVLLSLVEED
jgi:hypothetical protein